MSFQGLTYACFILLVYVAKHSHGQDPCDEENKIQLNNGGVFAQVQGAGRVEICVCSSVNTSSCYWQTVSTGSSTIPMSWKNSIVVCRSRDLGFLDVESPILQNTVQAGTHASSEVDIYPNTFVCDGTERDLVDCAVGTSTSGLPHTTDAYVNCFTETPFQRVRLVGTTRADEGFVEFYTENAWRTICPDFWSDSQANIVCTSLGYASGTATTYTSSTAVAASIESVTCTDDTTYFSSCQQTIGFSCSQLALAGAVCTRDTAQTDGNARLYSSSFSGFQRVEVYYAGRWGTVCDTVWNLEDGQVVCRELGGIVEQTTVSTTSVDFNSQSSRPIWITGYICDGSEDSLSSCPRPAFPVGYHSAACTHSTDAAVTCVYPSTSGGGGLSGGAIAGIVIGPLVFVGIMIWFITAQDRMKKRRAEAARQRASAHHPPPPQPVQAPPVVAVSVTPIRTQQERESVSSSSDSSGDDVSSKPSTSNPVFTHAPPPAYSEALKHLDVKDPPQYPDEEKKVPYPLAPQNNDPVYPSAPPPVGGASVDYQGYPAPTHVNQPPTAPIGYMPPQPNLPPPGAVPYPTGPMVDTPYPPVPPPSNLPYPTS